MTFRRLAFALLASLVLALPAAAETYPSRTITVVVPYPAGGPTDALGGWSASA
jgi:tripartite-type tricarboxylate transporter receptor subunit TctC